MKRMIISTTNKPKSSEDMTYKVNVYLQSHGLGDDYVAESNASHDMIVISERNTGAPVCEVSMKTVKEDTVRYGLRKATQDDLDEGKQLYVRYKYPTTVDKQIPEVDQVKNIVDILKK